MRTMVLFDNGEGVTGCEWPRGGFIGGAGERSVAACVADLQPPAAHTCCNWVGVKLPLTSQEGLESPQTKLWPRATPDALACREDVLHCGCCSEKECGLYCMKCARDLSVGTSTESHAKTHNHVSRDITAIVIGVLALLRLQLGKLALNLSCNEVEFGISDRAELRITGIQQVRISRSEANVRAPRTSAACRNV